ncbi:MAG: adenylosuccinate lyase, partial [Candidatus Aureabacteria bacterium]|nr:adenylosuccinate lyase [Candidatus Auribacterota bacterium]
TRKGVSREKAYRIVQRNAMKVWEKDIDFKGLLLKDNELTNYLSPAKIEGCFDLKYYLKDIDRMFRAAGIGKK